MFLAGFYKQAILMSGTDLSMSGVAKSFYRPRKYATQLAKLLNCPTEDSYGMLLCLRDNATRTWEDIVRAQSQIKSNVLSSILISKIHALSIIAFRLLIHEFAVVSFSYYLYRFQVRLM